MSAFEDRTLVEDLLANGVDDWVDEALVCGNIARRVVEDAADRRAVAIGLIASVLLAGQMEAGETPPGQGFRPWNLTPGEAVLRIASEWMARSDVNVYPGEIVWLRNTPAGNAIGEAVLESEAL